MCQHQIPNPRAYRHLERWLNISHKFLAKEEPPICPCKLSQDLPQGKAFGGMISKLYPPSKTPVESSYSSLSHVRLSETPWTVAHQAPLSTRFSRQENWSGLPFPSPRDLSNPGIELRYPVSWADFLPSKSPWKPMGLDHERLKV